MREESKHKSRINVILRQRLNLFFVGSALSAISLQTRAF
jgi:hypothetical protein